MPGARHRSGPAAGIALAISGLALNAAVAESIGNRGVIEFNESGQLSTPVANQGTIRIINRSTTLFFGPLVHNGTSIDIEAGSRAVFFDRVSGAGRYGGHGEVVFAGTFAPGNSPALVTFAGDVTFGVNSTLEIEIGGLLRGNEYDALDVGNTATLDGTLDVVLINGFVPVAGNSFDIIVAYTVVGQFATVQAPALGPGLFWVVDYDLDPGGNDTVRLLVDVDGDGDGVPNTQDNCSAVANNTGPGAQCDSDGDGFGNRCDGDFGNPAPGNGTTNSQDYILFRVQLGQPSVGPVYNKADINCNGAVNSQDYILFRTLLGLPPGPSGLVP